MLGALIDVNPRLLALGISEVSIVSRGLIACEEASVLEIAEIGTDGSEHLLIPSAAEAWHRLKVAALRDGITVYIVSAFRSIERQSEIIHRKLRAGIAIADILSVCAPPGYSEHHTGRAVDLSTPGSRELEIEFDRTAAYVWLQHNAQKFSFRLSYPLGNSWGYQHEPWHWCFCPSKPNGATGGVATATRSSG